MFEIGLTDHLEAPHERNSLEVYREVADFVLLADKLGVNYAWFAEHHAHVHYGHLPTPLLLAMHLLPQTKQIQLGSAIVCLNLHDPIDVAEQVAVADLLGGNRLAPGFGSGSTPEEAELFGRATPEIDALHRQFERSLITMRDAWADRLLPRPAGDLPQRCWVAVNSVESACIAGRMNYSILFSHLRTLDQYQQYANAYRAAGGRAKIAINRPVHVAADDETAWRQARPAIENLYQRFRREGKIEATRPSPKTRADWCAHPLNFLVGSADTVIRELNVIRQRIPFDVANFEMRWEGLPEPLVHESLSLLMAGLR